MISINATHVYVTAYVPYDIEYILTTDICYALLLSEALAPRGRGAAPLGGAHRDLEEVLRARWAERERGAPGGARHAPALGALGARHQLAVADGEQAARRGGRERDRTGSDEYVDTII